MNNNQAEKGEELVTKAIALMSEYDKPSLVALLKRSGSLVTELSSQQELLNASFQALKDSERFRQDLLQYIKDSTGGDTNYKNSIGDLFKSKVGGTRVGNGLKNVFSAENISSLAGIGIAYASTKLQDSAQKKGNQAATDYKVAEANLSLAETKRLEALALTQKEKSGDAAAPPSKEKPKWVIPVVIGGVVVLGVVLFFVFRKKK